MKSCNGLSDCYFLLSSFLLPFSVVVSTPGPMPCPSCPWASLRTDWVHWNLSEPVDRKPPFRHESLNKEDPAGAATPANFDMNGYSWTQPPEPKQLRLGE